MDEKLKKLTDRFEIAVENFARSCFNMKANEKCFQAWLASSLIQEFGLSRVYREIHFDKQLVISQTNIVKEKFKKELTTGSDLFPDIAISYSPNIDARSTQTRDIALRNPSKMLNEFAIICEFKVTSSTQKRTTISMVEQDLQKLLLFNLAHLSDNTQNSLATYLIILDNQMSNKNSSTDEYIKIIRKTFESLKDPRFKMKIIHLGSNISEDINSSEDFIIRNINRK